MRCLFWRTRCMVNEVLIFSIFAFESVTLFHLLLVFVVFIDWVAGLYHGRPSSVLHEGRDRVSSFLEGIWDWWKRSTRWHSGTEGTQHNGASTSCTATRHVQPSQAASAAASKENASAPWCRSNHILRCSCSSHRNQQTLALAVPSSISPIRQFLSLQYGGVWWLTPASLQQQFQQQQQQRHHGAKHEQWSAGCWIFDSHWSSAALYQLNF